MANEEAKLRDSLHRHLAQYNGQALTYEMVRKLMSFVFDMETNDPGIAWISKDSHIRLLNGMFKKVGQTVDDRYIASLEDSICSSLVFAPQPDAYVSAGRLAKPMRPVGRQTEIAQGGLPVAAGSGPKAPVSPPPPPAPDGRMTDGKDANGAYQRVLLDLAIFENRISRAIEAAAAQSREADKRLMEERIELEARLSRDRAELEAGFARDRALQDAWHAKERADMADFINRLYAASGEQTQKAEALLGTRLAAIETTIAALRESSLSAANEQSKKYENSAKETGSRFNAQLEGIARKLETLESKLDAAGKRQRRMTFLWALSLAVIAAGFYAVLFVK